MSFILAYRKPRAKLARARAPSQSSGYEELLKQRPIPQKLLNYEELPEWCRDNHFMRSGYRPISNSFSACARSMVQLHNETVNIHTHLIPAIAILLGQFFVYYAISQVYPEAKLLDYVVLGCNFFAAVITMGLSSTYHTLMCHSMHVSSLMLRVDYVGILTLILGSFFSGIYVGFYCEPSLRLIYWGMIVTLSLITAIYALHPKLQGSYHRTPRALAFVATGLSGFAPLIHGVFLYGWNQMWIRSGMPYYFLEGAVYCLGAFFFVTRVPESIIPGKFDIWLSSHQIFHVLVVIAALVHMYGVMVAFAWNYENQRTCPVAYA